MISDRYLAARDAARALGLTSVEATDDVVHAAGLMRAGAAALASRLALDLARFDDADQDAVAEIMGELISAAVAEALEAVQAVADEAG